MPKTEEKKDNRAILGAAVGAVGVGAAILLLTKKDTFSIVPTFGPSGTVVTVSGSGWDVADFIDTVTIDGMDAEHNLTIEADGELSGTITIPASLSLGNKEIVITSSSGKVAKTTFKVTLSKQWTPVATVETIVPLAGFDWETVATIYCMVPLAGVAWETVAAINCVIPLAGVAWETVAAINCVIPLAGVDWAAVATVYCSVGYAVVTGWQAVATINCSIPVTGSTVPPVTKYQIAYIIRWIPIDTYYTITAITKYSGIWYYGLRDLAYGEMVYLTVEYVDVTNASEFEQIYP